MDRPFVLLADAPSFASATRFQDREAEGAQKERPRYERGWIIFNYEGNLHGSFAVATGKAVLARLKRTPSQPPLQDKV